MNSPASSANRDGEGLRGDPESGDRFGIAAPGAARTFFQQNRWSAGSEPLPGRWQRWPRWQRRLVLLGVAVVVAGAGFLTGWVTMTPATVPALRLEHGVHAGARISAGDLGVVTLPTETEGIITAQQRAMVVGKTAKRRLPAGTLLRGDQLTTRGGMPKSGQARVGLSLQPGQYPAGGLAVGDKVRAVTAASGGEGSGARPVVLVSRAPVWEVRSRQDGLAVTVLVRAGVANRLAAYAAAGQVSLIRLGDTG